ncbi:MAG: Npt1/Npt2 family nucleotide transporter, partial [bacterium]|nr:Npt1/Npt2 family nucleotide transporter [bacterium]
MGIAIVSYFAASTALFLTEFGSESLPYVYIASAVVSTLTGVVYARFEKKLPIQKLLVGTLSFLLLSVSVFRVGIQLTDARWPAFCLMAWYTVLHALLSVEFWGLASRLFDVRQGKRLFGLLGAGEMIASVTGGLMTPLFIRYFGTPNLLLVSAVGLAFCLLILGEIIRHFGGHLERARDPGETSNVRHIRYRDLLKNRYIRLLLLLYLLAVTVVYFVDFNFLEQAKIRYQNRDELARFFGLFYGIAQAVTLILITFATGRLISRYGVRIGMRVRPVILTVCTLALVLNAFGLGPVGLVFWLAATTKLFDLVLYRVASAPAFQVLYQPIRPAPRLAAQLSAESMVGPIAGGLVGATLLLVQWLDISSGLVLGTVTLLVLVAWMKTGARTYRQYRRALAEALRKRRLEGSSLSLDDETTLDILTSRLKSAHPGEVMYAISLLERLEHKDLSTFLI